MFTDFCVQFISGFVFCKRRGKEIVGAGWGREREGDVGGGAVVVNNRRKLHVWWRRRALAARWEGVNNGDTETGRDANPEGGMDIPETRVVKGLPLHPKHHGDTESRISCPSLLAGPGHWEVVWCFKMVEFEVIYSVSSKLCGLG